MDPTAATAAAAVPAVATAAAIDPPSYDIDFETATAAIDQEQKH
jgi:hypothetical protein